MPTGHDAAAAAAQRAALAAFGRTVRYLPAGGAPVDVQATYRAGGGTRDVGGVPVIATVPTLGVRVSDLPATVRRGADRVEIDGVTFVVEEVLPDGRGWVRILLQATARRD